MIYDTYPREGIIANKYLHGSLKNIFFLPVFSYTIEFNNSSGVSWAVTQKAKGFTCFSQSPNIKLGT